MRFFILYMSFNSPWGPFARPQPRENIEEIELAIENHLFQATKDIQ